MNRTERPNANPAVIAFWTWVISAVLYVSACFLPVLDFGPAREPSDLDFDAAFGPSGPTIGLAVLLIGWMDGNAATPWSANAILMAAVVCLPLRRYVFAATLAVVAALLGLATWVDYHLPCQVLVGAYVWVASMIVLAVGAAWAAGRRSCQPELETGVSSSRE